MEKELAFAILLSRLEFTDTILLRIFHLAKASFDWDRFLIHLIKGRTIGLVYANMVSHNLLYLLPSHIKRTMESCYMATEHRNVTFRDECVRIEQAVQKENLSIYPIKGCALLEQLYMLFLGARVISDMDFLVKESELPLVEKELSELGYHLEKVNGEDPLLYTTQKPLRSKLYSKRDEKWSSPIKVDLTVSYQILTENTPISLQTITLAENKDVVVQHALQLICLVLDLISKHTIMDSNVELAKLVDIYEYYRKYYDPLLDEVIFNFFSQYGLEGKLEEIKIGMMILD